MFKQLDVNGDGRVNFDEFIAACYDRRSLLNDENLKLAFDLLDVDNDGKIQKRDLAACLASTSTMNDIDVGEEIWTSLAGDADANQDDEITFTEFKRYMKEHTAKDERDKDSPFANWREEAFCNVLSDSMCTRRGSITTL